MAHKGSCGSEISEEEISGNFQHCRFMISRHLAGCLRFC